MRSKVARIRTMMGVCALVFGLLGVWLSDHPANGQDTVATTEEVKTQGIDY